MRNSVRVHTVDITNHCYILSCVAQNEALKSELRTVSGYLETAQRNVEMFKAEAASFAPSWQERNKA